MSLHEWSILMWGMVGGVCSASMIYLAIINEILDRKIEKQEKDDAKR